ncbi:MULTISPECIES: hypothetical protein [Leptospira]|uniref:Uncharacterized protein n=1 Tax=Leptospira vanthielii TaxID=293085 RepID=A0ABY2NU83_9LEPT|nr:MULTISPECIES: hypothetical protein [Leptospira]MBM9548751.1 hypothetical protein [Leptospira abararensis]TGM61735.1 hypothetical protein EHQ95_00355 [Leptospira vanthielii]
MKSLIQTLQSVRSYNYLIENYFGKYLEDRGYKKFYEAKKNEYVFENDFRIVKINNDTHPSDYGFSVFLYNKLKKEQFTILIHIPNSTIDLDLKLKRNSFYALLSNKKAIESIETKKWHNNLKVFWIKETALDDRRIIRTA